MAAHEKSILNNLKKLSIGNNFSKECIARCIQTGAKIRATYSYVGPDLGSCLFAPVQDTDR